MSITSELAALTANLAAAKQAVTRKGGTVGNTGIAGLAEEVGEIPYGPVLVTGVSITSPASTTDIYIGGSNVVLQATVTPSNATNKNVTWSTSDSNTVAVVLNQTSGNYEAQAVAAGVAYITVTTADGSFTDTVRFNSKSAPTSYGKIAYYSSFSQQYDAVQTNACTVNSINQSAYASFLTNYGVSNIVASFSYMEWTQQWQTWSESGNEINISPSDMLSTTGINVTIVPDPEVPIARSNFSIKPVYTVDTTSPLVEATLTQSEYNGITGNGNYTIGGTSVPKDAIATFEFGTAVTTMPTYFLNDCHNLTTVTGFENSQVQTISQGAFSYSTSLNCPITVPSTVTTIGLYAFNGLSSFNSTITLNSGITTIQAPCFQYMNAMTGTINVGSILPRVISNSGRENMLATNDNTVPCYTTGITLAGAEAADWHTALPDRTTIPYRKTIVAS